MASRRIFGDERGSSPVEFVLVGTLLTLLTLGVLQLALVVYVRNILHDAAVEGAYHAALADTTLEQGAGRAEQVIDRGIGEAYSEGVTISRARSLGHATIVVRVSATLPVIGLLGVPQALSVEAHAPEETFDDR